MEKRGQCGEPSGGGGGGGGGGRGECPSGILRPRDELGRVEGIEGEGNSERENEGKSE